MKTWLFLGAVNGFIAVLAGAFATHALERRGLDAAQGLFEIAARYQMFHALALFAVAWLGAKASSQRFPGPRLAGVLFAAGIVLFSGSLYALALTNAHALVYFTPLGGLAFLAGWGVLALTALRLE